MAVGGERGGDRRPGDAAAGVPVVRRGPAGAGAAAVARGRARQPPPARPGGVDGGLRRPRRAALDGSQLRRLRTGGADLDRRRPGPLRGELPGGRARPGRHHLAPGRALPMDRARARTLARADLPRSGRRRARPPGTPRREHRRGPNRDGDRRIRRRRHRGTAGARRVRRRQALARLDRSRSGGDEIASLAGTADRAAPRRRPRPRDRPGEAPLRGRCDRRDPARRDPGPGGFHRLAAAHPGAAAAALRPCRCGSGLGGSVGA